MGILSKSKEDRESQSLVNEGRFPLKDSIIQFINYFKKQLLSQSLVNEGRFPHDSCEESY